MTALLVNPVILFASADLGRAFQSHSRRSGSGEHLLLFVGVALAVIGLLAAMAYWERRRKRKRVKTDTELLLFRNLCRIHQLPAAEIQLLQQAAESASLPRRSDIFVDPSILASHAKRSGANSKRYAKLHQKLFAAEPGELAPPAISATAG